MQEVTQDRLDALLSSLAESPALDLCDHCLLIFESGGSPRSFYESLPLGTRGSVLQILSPLPFPLNLIPSHAALIAVNQPSELQTVFNLVATQNQTHVIYAPIAFQAHFVARLQRWISPLNLRSRFALAGYNDFLAPEQDYFALVVELSYDEPLTEVRYGKGLSPVLQTLLANFAG